MKADELLNIFNTQFQEMLKDLIMVFPDDTDFAFFQTAGTMLVRSDKRAVLALFNSNVAEHYGRQILNKDDEFFLKVDYSQYTYDDWSNMLVSKLKNYWSNLSNENRDVIWKYLQILVKLNDKIKEQGF